jgi:branched-subunit amino acid aminotransferase/4-amino-4-deoxychorismate lyase
MDDLRGAHEAFLASTVREVQAVSAIDDHRLEPGRWAAEAEEAFRRSLEGALRAPSEPV